MGDELRLAGSVPRVTWRGVDTNEMRATGWGAGVAADLAGANREGKRVTTKKHRRFAGGVFLTLSLLGRKAVAIQSS